MRVFTLQSSPMLLVCLVLFAAASARADISFEFDQDGVLPSAQGAEYWPAPGSPYRIPEASAFGVGAGMLQQNTLPFAATGGYLVRDAADRGRDIVIEWRMQILGYGSPWGGGCSLGVVDSTVSFWRVWYLDIAPWGIRDTYTGNRYAMDTTSAFHTFRLEIPAGQTGYTVYVDGVQAFSQEHESISVPLTDDLIFRPGSVFWGDQSVAPAARADWDYVRVSMPVPNSPPTAVAWADPVCEGTGVLTPVLLDGSSSSDPDGDALQYRWTLNGLVVGDEALTVAQLPLGTHQVVLTVTDSAGQSSSDTVTIEVIDTTSPSITALAADRAVLWPPNHRLVDVVVNYDIGDACDPAPRCVLMVCSNEPDDAAGDGNTSTDWEVVGPHHVRLRSERAGNGAGRIYTVTVTATDASGNVSTRSVTVTVPKSMGK